MHHRFLTKGLVPSILTLSFSSWALSEDSTIEHIDVYGSEFVNGLQLDENNSSSNRLGLSVLETPASVDIISKEAIALKADYSSLAAVSRSTGFASSASPGNGGLSFSVRGFEGHNSIVQTYDGTRLYVGSGASTFPADTWTFEQIDVLRGPGSVINGVGAIGATVNYVPKKPTFSDRQTELDLTAGSNSLRRIAVGSGGRIQENTAYRIDAVNHYSAGYVDNASEERNVIASALTYKPVNDLAITFSLDYANVDAPTYWGMPLVNGKVDNRLRQHNYNINDAIVNYEDLWSRVHIDWMINDHVKFKSYTYYIDAQRHWKNTEDYYVNLVDQEVTRKFYIEILHDQEQLGNRSDILFNFQLGNMPNRLNVGVEINQIDFSHTNNSPYDEQDPTVVEVFQPDLGYWSQAKTAPTTRDFSSSTLQYAVFFDHYIEVLPMLSVVAGARYDAIDYQRDDVARPDNGDQPASKVTNDFSTTSWRAGVVYSPIKDSSLYLQYSEASDAIQWIITSTNANLKLAEGKQIELGLKQSLLADKLQYTLAIFDIKKSNLMSKVLGGDDRQIGQQSSKGAEVDVYIHPVEQFDMSANFAYYRAKYDNFAENTGNRPKNVPTRTANLWMNWRPIDDWQLSTGLRYVGNRFQNDENTKRIPSYRVFDASVAWQVNPSMQLALRGKNLNNSKNYVLGAYGNQWVLGPGRTAEVGLNYRF